MGREIIHSAHTSLKERPMYGDFLSETAARRVDAFTRATDAQKRAALANATTAVRDNAAGWRPGAPALMSVSFTNTGVETTTYASDFKQVAVTLSESGVTQAALAVPELIRHPVLASVLKLSQRDHLVVVAHDVVIVTMVREQAHHDDSPFTGTRLVVDVFAMLDDLVAQCAPRATARRRWRCQCAVL